MRYGYVGIGNLGSQLAMSLIHAGFDLTVYDRDHAAAARLGEVGATVAPSLAALAEEVDHIFTCLPNPQASEVVLAQVLPALRPGATWIENSTLGRDDVLRLAHLADDQGVGMLEAMVTGGLHRASRGEITLLVGGPEALYQIHQPALKAMGRQHFHMGPLGSAALMKVITNMLAFAHLVLDGEAMMLAKRGGLDLRTAWEAISASSGSSFVHETEGQLILNGSYQIGFTMDLALKDLDFAMRFGREFGVPLDLASQVNQTFLKGRAAYGGKAQSTQIVKLLEDLLQTELRAEGFPARLG